MKALPGFAACALFLAGCEDGAPERNVTQVVAANTYSDQLKALSEPTRLLGLYRAVRDTGQRCKRVDRGAYQQQYKSMAMWTAHCTDSGDWALYIAPNGDVQASPCAHAKELGLPECRVQAGAASEKR
ncbi:MAG TPA: hypothetical protein VF718_13915 [Allosphingosinicella sp.]|jgi:hypothetical protein